jgi:hypothetical protein
VQLNPEIDVTLYYVRVVDPNVMATISALASRQFTSTEDTKSKLLQVLKYCATHPDAIIHHHASCMILNIHSNAGYLNKTVVILNG